MPAYNQVRGADCRVVMYPESALKTLATPVKGVVVPLLSESFTAKPNKQTKATITGKRAPGRPYRGAWQMGAGLNVPANVHLVPHLLLALCGAPVKTTVATQTLDAAAATDEGGGLVGIPCAAHGLEVDAVISITGSIAYDGTYRLQDGTTADKLMIKATYATETFAGTEILCRGIARFLDASGDAVDNGDGTVGIPCADHGFKPGETVTLDGTIGYDDDYELTSATTADVLVITETFSTETFAGTEIVSAKFYKRVFSLPKTQPSRMFEKFFDHDAGAATNEYDRYYGCKIDGLRIAYGGDGQLTLDVGITPSKFAEAVSAAASGSNVTTLPDVDFGMFEAAAYLDSLRLTELEDGQFDLGLGLEGKYGVGDHGEISRLNEGDPTLGGSLNCFLETDTLLNKARNDTPVQVDLAIFGARGEELWLTYPEAELNTDGRQIAGKTGLSIGFEILGYGDTAASCFTAVTYTQQATLIGEA
jgi:hypothetical protein